MARPKRTERTPGRHRQWQCPCGAKHGLEVVRTEHDEDGYIVRLRVCKNCGEPMATEERPINLASFYPRAMTHAQRNAALMRARKTKCRHCGEMYRYGKYSKHVRRPEHIAVLKTQPTDASRARDRVKRRREYWAKQGITLLEGREVESLLKEARPTIKRVPA